MFDQQARFWGVAPSDPIAALKGMARRHLGGLFCTPWSRDQSGGGRSLPVGVVLSLSPFGELGQPLAPVGDAEYGPPRFLVVQILGDGASFISPDAPVLCVVQEPSLVQPNLHLG